MATIMDERPTRKQQGTISRVRRSHAAAASAARAAGKVALFLDGHNPITRQVARGVMEFVRNGHGRPQASSAAHLPRWNIVLGDDLRGVVPSARAGFGGVSPARVTVKATGRGRYRPWARTLRYQSVRGRVSGREYRRCLRRC